MSQQENRRLSRRALLKGMALGGTALLLGACQPQVVEVEKVVKETVLVEAKAPEPVGLKEVTIIYWFAGGQLWEDFYTQKVFPLFYERYPHIKIEHTLIGSWSDLYNKLVTSTAGGAPPEVARQKDFMTPDFAVRGLQQELTDYVATVNHITDDKYEPLAWKNCHWSGKLVALPLHIFIHHVHMSKELFAKAGLVDDEGMPIPPDTWDDVREYGRKITDPDNQVYGTILRDEGGKEDTVNFFQVWLAQAGGQLTDEEYTKFTFNSPEGLEALTFQVSLIKDGIMKPPGVSIPGLIPGNHVGMWWHAANYWPGYVSSNPDFEFANAVNPKNKNRGAVIRANHLALYSGAAHKDEGFLWMAFHQEPDIDYLYGQERNYITARLENWEKPYYKQAWMGKKGPSVQVEFEQFRQPGNQPQPIFPGYQESTYKIGALLMLAYMGELEPAACLEQAEKEGNLVLETTRRLLHL